MKRWFYLLALAAPAVQASPFLVSDPWPANVAQPTSCLYQEGTAPVVEAPVASGPDGVSCRFDLGTVTKTPHTYQVWAKNLGGESVKVPFAFTLAVPAAPTGIRIIP